MCGPGNIFNNVMQFKDRYEAGRKLAAVLRETVVKHTGNGGKEDMLLLALPRGGVPVASEIAKALSLPFDVLLVRKIGIPGQDELAMGAIAWGEIQYLNQDLIKQMQIPDSAVEQVVAREKEELSRRNRLYRGDRPVLAIDGKTIIVVDDGLATGATMHAAVEALKEANAGRIIVAVPVGAADTCQKLQEDKVVDVVCLHIPEPFYGVGRWYEDFSQTSDEEVLGLLAKSAPGVQGNEQT